MPAADPIGGEEAAHLFRFLDGADAIAVAVSGGPDSIALLALVAGWQKARGRPRVHVLTVDHGLRDSSAAEAAHVAEAARGFGFEAEILSWRGEKPRTGIEEAARQARYALLVEATLAAGASHLLTAHHLDDQAETFLMRLARGSGPFGLSAMARTSEVNGVILSRPLLDVAKDRLVATAEAAGVGFVRDPMNEDERFERSRWRRLAPDLAREGLDAKRLGLAAQRMARVGQAIDHYATMLLREGVTVDALATARLDRNAYAAAPTEVRLRSLVRILRAIGGERSYPPRLDHLEALDQTLSAGGEPFRRTLARVVADGRVDEATLFYREIGRHTPLPLLIQGRFDGIWDNRFAVAVEVRSGNDPVLEPLGRDHVAAVGAADKSIPAAALAALPSLRIGGKVIAPGAREAAIPGVSFTARSILAERLLAA